MTTTLFNIIRSELIKKGLNEFVDDEGNLVLFNEEHQFMTKIFSYDEDVSEIVDNLFSGLSLKDPDHDLHFKKTFIYRFINRRINRQTIEAFKLELLSVFMSHQDYINRVYLDMEKYVTQTTTSESQNEQTNNQLIDGTTTSDNRSAFADLPQSTVNLDVDNTVMQYPSDNTISRNRQTNQQQTDGTTTFESNSENKVYRLDELFKTNGILEEIFNKFDRKCFMQVW